MSLTGAPAISSLLGHECLQSSGRLHHILESLSAALDKALCQGHCELLASQVCLEFGHEPYICCNDFDLLEALDESLSGVTQPLGWVADCEATIQDLCTALRSFGEVTPNGVQLLDDVDLLII